MTNELLKHVFSLALASSVGILAVLLTRRPARYIFGSSACYSLWLLVPVAMLAVLLPHVGSSVAISWRIESVSALRHAVGSPSLGTAPSIRWQAFALGMWCAGAALLAAYLALQQRAFVKSLGRLSGSRCALRTSRSGGCPAVLGVLRPKIILPADFESRYTRLERLLIFSHERVHLRRGDAICNGFIALIRCFFWFNPLVHLASSYFRIDQEFACDAAVMLEYPASRRTYAGAMLKAQLADLALPAGCNWRSSQALKERVQMLKQGTPTGRRRLFGGVAIMFLSLVVGCTTWVAQPTADAPKSLPGITLQSATGPIEITADHVQQVSPSVMDLQGDVRLVVRSEVRTLSDRILFKGDSETLEGHARLTITGTAHGGAHAEIIIFQTDRATLSHPRKGDVIVRFEKGTMRRVPAAGNLT